MALNISTSPPDVHTCAHQSILAFIDKSKGPCQISGLDVEGLQSRIDINTQLYKLITRWEFKAYLLGCSRCIFNIPFCGHTICKKPILEQFYFFNNAKYWRFTQWERFSFHIWIFELQTSIFCHVFGDKSVTKLLFCVRKQFYLVIILRHQIEVIWCHDSITWWNSDVLNFRNFWYQRKISCADVPEQNWHHLGGMIMSST